MAVGAVRGIDPYGEGLPAHVERTRRIDDEPAGAVLVVEGHRVLEIEDELVRVELGGLGEEPLAGAGDDVDAPSGTGAFHPSKVTSVGGLTHARWSAIAGAVWRRGTIRKRARGT